MENIIFMEVYLQIMKNKLLELRHQYNLTQQELAEKVRVTRRTIISLENGKYNPSLELAFKLSMLFKVSIEEIFQYEGDSIL